jgi:hypothetical protein
VLSLVVCRDLEGLGWVERHARELGAGLVVASDDLRVQKAAGHFPGVVAVCFIERIEALYVVADEVIRQIRRINEWLVRLTEPRGIELPALIWSEYCEGGHTTQRIQDGLLLLRSYQALIQKHRPESIWLVRSADATWEDDLFMVCAQNAGIPVHRVGRLGPVARVRRVMRRWRHVAKEVYFSGRVVSAKILMVLRPPLRTSPDRTVAVQLCDSAKKHLNHTVPLLRALDAVGLEGVAVCWNGGRAVGWMRRQGLRAEAMEAYVPWRVLVGSWFKTWRTWRRAKAAQAQFLDGDQPEERLLRGIMWESMQIFFEADVGQRQRMYVGMCRYWRQHPPRAARLWTRVLWQGVVAYRAMEAVGVRPLLFWQPGWPYQILDPFLATPVPTDRVYAISEAHVQKLQLAHGVTLDQTLVVGLFWMERVLEFKRLNSRADSRRFVGIPNGTELCVLCDPSYFCRGYMAAAEQVALLETLLETARANPKLHLLIKPHPSHKTGLLEVMVRDSKASNVTVIPKGNLPYHALNAADVLVTKYSTLAVEGMVLGVPGIGFIMDRVSRYNSYDDAVHYVWDAQELRNLVERLLHSPEYRTAWTEDIQRKGVKFLTRHCAAFESSANDKIAIDLKRLLPC